MESLSAILKERRKALGLTLAQIANQMGVAEATVQRWESGNIKNIRYDKIGKLAEILKVEPAAIMGWDDPLYQAAIETTLVKEFTKLSVKEQQYALDCVAIPSIHDYELELREPGLIYQFRSLNSDGQEKLLDYADDLVQSGKYVKKDATADTPAVQAWAPVGTGGQERTDEDIDREVEDFGG